jgi:hypothetical protein
MGHPAPQACRSTRSQVSSRQAAIAPSSRWPRVGPGCTLQPIRCPPDATRRIVMPWRRLPYSAGTARSSPCQATDCAGRGAAARSAVACRARRSPGRELSELLEYPRCGSASCYPGRLVRHLTLAGRTGHPERTITLRPGPESIARTDPARRVSRPTRMLLPWVRAVTWRNRHGRLTVRFSSPAGPARPAFSSRPDRRCLMITSLTRSASAGHAPAHGMVSPPPVPVAGPPCRYRVLWPAASRPQAGPARSSRAR